MKFILLLLCMLPGISMAGDLFTYQEFKALNSKQQVEVLKVYKAFIQEALKNEVELENLSAKLNISLFREAIASDTFNCFYAGWPSKKVIIGEGEKKKTLCTSPMKSNNTYKKMAEVCQKNEILCQPVLFGQKLCIEASTAAQRNSVFSLCQKKFSDSGRTLEEVAKSLKEENIAVAADEVFALVYEVCDLPSFQAKTPMCHNLKSRVASIREAFSLDPEESKKDSLPRVLVKIPKLVSKPAPKITQVEERKVQVIDKGKVSNDEILREKLVESVEKVSDVSEVSSSTTGDIQCNECEQTKKSELQDQVLAPHEASELIDQNKATPKDYCAANRKGTEIERYTQGVFKGLGEGIDVNIEYKQKGKDQSQREVSGYNVFSDRMGRAYDLVENGVPLKGDDAELIYPTRVYSSSFDGRGKDGSFEVTDSPVKEIIANNKVVSTYASTDFRMTQYSFFPRKYVPSIKKRENNIIMKLTNGEEIVLDAQTGRVISGAAVEKKAANQIEVRAKDRRIYPETDFSYQGQGLFIESRVYQNKDERKPGSIVSAKALVEGKWQECKLKSEDIWTRDWGNFLPQDHKDYLSSSWSCYRFKFEKDEELYDLIKKTCPTFKFPPLVKQ